MPDCWLLCEVWEEGTECWTDCSCGSKWTVFVREDVSEYKDAARTFEQEERLFSEIERETKRSCGSFSSEVENSHDYFPSFLFFFFGLLKLCAFLSRENERLICNLSLYFFF